MLMLNITKHHNQLKISCMYSNDRNRRKERYKTVFFKMLVMAVNHWVTS